MKEYKFIIRNAKGKTLGIHVTNQIDDLDKVNKEIKEKFPEAYTKQLLLDK